MSIQRSIAVAFVILVAVSLGACGADSGATLVPTPNVTGASGPPAGESPAGAATELTIGTTTGGELQFDPTTASVPTGGQIRLTFENRDTVPHDLTFQDPIDAKTAAVVDPGASEVLEFQAPAPGTYTFVCMIHPGMEGTLEVTP